MNVQTSPKPEVSYLHCRSARIWLVTAMVLVLRETGFSADQQPASSDGTWPIYNVEAVHTTGIMPGPMKAKFANGGDGGQNAGPVGGFLKDIDRDGLPDFITIFEEGGVRLNFNPGPKRVRDYWPFEHITPYLTDSDGEGLAAEDLDGDGSVDIVLAMGVTGPGPGTKRDGVGQMEVLWGPGNDHGQMRDANAWTDLSIIPASVNNGNYNFTRVYDVNGDGRPDIVAGPNNLDQNGARDYPYGGLQWYESPEKDRRNMANWKLHLINGEYLGSTYGFERADIDGDGFQDFLVIDSDVRYGATKPGQEKLVWFKNPGDGTEAQKNPWSMHVVYHPGPNVFGIKTHIAVGDLNGDGAPDIAAQSPDSILIFVNGNKGQSWSRVSIPKPYLIHWKGRSIAITDVDGDGKNDILGALERATMERHSIDKDRAAIFWLKCEGGNDLRADNWVLFPIKRGQGDIDIPATARRTTTTGEKWNRFFFHDFDQDGAQDVIANVEEYTTPVTDMNLLSVHWFRAPFASDHEAPSAPKGVRVVAEGRTTRLDWSASTDNQAVIGYKIYRDGAFHSFTSNFNGEVLTFSEEADGAHTYGVAAFDAAGHTSKTSSAETR